MNGHGDGVRRMKRSRLDAAVRAGVGLLGVAGETYIIHHTLVDCYPYTQLNYPPPTFYQGLAATGSLLVPTVAALIAVWLFRRRAWHAAPTLAFLCPLLYLIVFLVLTRVFYPGELPESIPNFDGYTKARIAREFVLFATTLAGAGAVIGGAFSAVLAIMPRLVRRLGWPLRQR